MGVFEYVEDGKIGPHVTNHERAKRERDETELRDRRRSRHSHQHGIVLARSSERDGHLNKRQCKRKHESVVA